MKIVVSWAAEEAIEDELVRTAEPEEVDGALHF